MAEQVQFGVVTGRKQMARMIGENAIREATTGRVIAILPRVWAVASSATVDGPAQSSAARETGNQRSSKVVPAAELAFYRKYTERLLQRYMQMTMEAGRVPSMMGREVIGGKASSYQLHGFDDAVNFRIDVERCLGRLEAEERTLIRRIALQEYTQAETAALLGMSLRTCIHRYGRAVDRLTRILLEVRLLEPFKALSRGGA